MARRIVVTSGKGGVGKTTFTASVGNAIARAGKKVLLIDADVGLNNLDVLMAVDAHVVYDMKDILDGRCRIKQALIQSADNPDLYILPSVNAMTSEDIGSKSFRNLIQRLSEGFDYLLIDCPAGIERGFHRAVSAANEAVVVVTPHVSSIRDADKVISLLNTYNLNSTSLVVNRVRGDLVLSGEALEPNDISELLKTDLIGVIRDDDKINMYSEIGRLGECVERDDVFNVIADNIITGRRRILDVTREYKGIVGKLKIFLRKAVV